MHTADTQHAIAKWGQSLTRGLCNTNNFVVNYPSMARRFPNGSSSTCAKHRKTGINPKWMEEFPWLLSIDDGSGMKCSLCRKHSHRPKSAGVGKAPWVDVACKSLTQQSVVKHSKSEVHLSAVRMEADLSSSRRDGGIAMAMQQVVSAQRKAFIGALKCLNKREIAHTTNFVPLLELSKSLGVSYLADID